MMQMPETPVLPLRDIKLPPEPGFWPLAPGWWFLIVLLTILLLWLAIKWRKHVQRKKRWQEIDEQLSAIEFSFKQNKNKQVLLNETSEFLRRFVKFQLHQHQATSLPGNQWIDHLNNLQGGAAFTAFNESLTVGVFQQNHDFDAQKLLQITRAFIKQQIMKPQNHDLTNTVEAKDV